MMSNPFLVLSRSLPMSSDTGQSMSLGEWGSSISSHVVSEPETKLKPKWILHILTKGEAVWYIISRASVCMSVWLSVCLSILSNDNFRKPPPRKFIFAHPVQLDRIRVKFVYEGHRVKVKVTGAIKSSISPIPAMWNFDGRSFIQIQANLARQWSINQSINQSIYLSRNAIHTGPDTKGGCNFR